jgi:hypothetical protein
MSKEGRKEGRKKGQAGCGGSLGFAFSCGFGLIAWPAPVKFGAAAPHSQICRKFQNPPETENALISKRSSTYRMRLGVGVRGPCLARSLKFFFLDVSEVF